MGRPTVHDLVIHHTTAACICWDDYFGSRVDLSSAGLKFIVQFLEQTTQCMKSIPMKLLRCTVLISVQEISIDVVVSACSLRVAMSRAFENLPASCENKMAQHWLPFPMRNNTCAA
jgi:hypothetical protein